MIKNPMYLTAEVHSYNTLAKAAFKKRSDINKGRHTVSKQRIRVGIVQRLRRTQRNSSRVAIGIVLSTRAVDGRGMGKLMQGGGGLVLVVAGGSQGREGAVVQVAVGDDVVSGKGPGEDVGAAVPVCVCAEVLG